MDCPHSGALLPVIAQRVSMGNQMFNVGDKPNDIATVMQQLYFDLAGKGLPYQLPTLLAMVDENKIVYGADAPYTTDQVVKLLSDEIETSDILSESQKRNFYLAMQQHYLNDNHSEKDVTIYANR